MRVEPIDSATAFTIMEDFVMLLPESVAKTSLARALERNRPFRRFKDALYDHGPLRDQWHRFHEDRMLEIARAWLVENGIKNTLGALPWRTN
ncbi:MAG: hypothetical protein IT353_11320 [Gemmatimonadaceae bacterium]|nr:hypothetical protein [Gemmatimonadaceae bacterium]